MALTPGCRHSIFSDLSLELRSFGSCEHRGMPRCANVGDYTPRTKSEEGECNDASNRGKHYDIKALVSQARRRIGVREVMGRGQTGGECRSWWIEKGVSGSVGE